MQLLLALNNSRSPDGVAYIARQVLYKEVEEHGVVVSWIFQQEGSGKDDVYFAGTGFWKFRQHAPYRIDLIVSSRIFDRVYVCAGADIGHYASAEVAFFVVVTQGHYEIGNAKCNRIEQELSAIHLFQFN